MSNLYETAGFHIFIVLNFLKKNIELSVWICALTALAIMPPSNTGFSFCIFRLMGFENCPGCGLGHAISHLFHGDISASFSAHPLGIFAVAVILIRIYKLIQLHFNKSKQNAIR